MRISSTFGALFCCGLIFAAASDMNAEAAFIRVPTDFATVGDAVTAAFAGDIIILESGDHHQATTVTVALANLSIVGEHGARLFAGNNDSADANRNVFLVSADGVTIKNIIFLPRDGFAESRAAVVVLGANDFTFAENTVGAVEEKFVKVRKGWWWKIEKQTKVFGFTDGVFCTAGCDDMKVYENRMIIVERRAPDGTIQGGNAAVTGLNGSDRLYAARNVLTGPPPFPGRDTPATVGIIDFNNVPPPSAFNVQIDHNTISGFDTAIFVSSVKCLVEENSVVRSGNGISLGQGPSDFNDGTDAAEICIVKRNTVEKTVQGIEVELGSGNLLLENDVKHSSDVDIILDVDATDNLLRGNKAFDVVDDGTGNLQE